jgi:hypothetical protein
MVVRQNQQGRPSLLLMYAANHYAFDSRSRNGYVRYRLIWPVQRARSAQTSPEIRFCTPAIAQPCSGISLICQRYRSSGLVCFVQTVDLFIFSEQKFDWTKMQFIDPL